MLKGNTSLIQLQNTLRFFKKTQDVHFFTCTRVEKVSLA